jgi:pimeloyl-ACP methyl ester carboxylesterase
LESRAIGRVLVIGTSLGALMAMVLAAMQPARIAGIVLNDAGPELDPKGLTRIAGYAGKLPRVRSWAEAAAQAKGVYGAALPGLTEADWLDYARSGYREDEQGAPIPDMDPKISEAFKTTTTAPADLWPLYGQIEKVPILAIRGALSDILSAETLARMGREKPDLEQLTVANRGHTPLLNEPECLEAIDSFLARHGASRDGAHE